MPIALAVNGVKFEVPCSVDPTLSLHEYLRVNTPFKVFLPHMLPRALCSPITALRGVYSKHSFIA